VAHVSAADMWRYREGAAPVEDIVGFSIKARDGDIGRVDSANAETGSAYLIVATGPWIVGKTVMLPAGVMKRIDYKDKVVHVDRTMDAIKNAPEYHEEHHADETYRSQLGGYYDSQNPGAPGSV
jgi:hypothetical protein